MTVAEQIYELVQDLSEEQASKVLTFAKSVHSEDESAGETSDPEPSETDDVSWHELLKSLSGAWKDDDFPTLEEIRAGQGEDAPRGNC